jgi:Ca2+-binding RTX toxin-like protein/subtilisin-like proprotein convertase family protein
MSADNNDSRGTYTLSVTERNIPADDAGNDLSTQASIAPGDTFSGNLLTANDEDWFKISLVEGEAYVFKVEGLTSGQGTLVDPVLTLFNSDGVEIRSVDNMLVSNDPAIGITAPTTGTYYLAVKGADNSDTGTYQLVTRAPDDHGDTEQTATAIIMDDVVQGNIGYNDGAFGIRALESNGSRNDSDKDWFKFSVTEGEAYSFSAQFADGSTLSRPMVEVVDDLGRTVAIGDGMETDNGLAAATFIASRTGSFFARVIDGAGAVGDYKVSLTVGDVSDEDANSPVEMAFIDNAGSIEATNIGRIALAGDTDTYTIALQQGHEYRIETVAVRDGTYAPIPNAQLDMSFEPAGSDNLTALFTKTVVENGDGSYTVNFFIDESVKSDWSEGVENFYVVLNYQDSRIGSLDEKQFTYADGAVGASDHTFGESVISGMFYPAAFDVNSTDAMFSITLDSVEAINADEFEVAELYFDRQLIEPTPIIGAPTAFEQGYIVAGEDGTLTIEISPNEANQTGQYQIRVVDLGEQAPDDRANTVADFSEETGGVLAINESMQGKIDSEDDVDLFAINLSVGNLYDFSVKSYFDGLGTLTQADLRLLDENGNLVSAGTYDELTGRTELAISVFTEGRYFLEVSGSDLPGNLGTYTLDTRLRGQQDNENDDYTADAQSSAVVSPGNPLEAEIEVAGDRDWARVTLETGKVYLLDLLAAGAGDSSGTLSDSVLRVFDANGTEVAFDDNTGAGKDSRITFTPAVSGEYYIDVSGKTDAVGTYTLRVRELYSGVADPLIGAQWYLDQLNIPEINGEYTGAGITVGVVDDGIDYAHPDLLENLDLANSYDTQFDNNDGSPKYPYLFGEPDNHGTAIAGIIAAVANNETGIVGTAQDAELASTRVKWSWEDITQAVAMQWQFDVSNNSWGAITPFEDNFNSTSMTFAWVGMRKGVELGRDGLGTVYVFSAGNSAGEGDNTNYHNFQNAREVITVGSVDSNDFASGFSTPGANVLVAAYGENIITTDRSQSGWGYNAGSDYVDNFQGSSASAAMVSGIVAMMLEANPDLGYRDVQKILAYSSRNSDSQTWKENGASDLNLGGLSFNDKSGFGVVDAWAAVQLARTWTTTNTAYNEVSASDRQFGMLESIPDGDGTSFTMSFDIDAPINIEHVELGVDVRHERLGDLIITLTSPNGTVSTLLNRPTVNDDAPFGLTGDDSGIPNHLIWDFSSVQFWGEDASGTWTVTVTDVAAEETGTIQSLSLRVYGEEDNGNNTYVFTDEGFKAQSAATLEDDSGIDAINAAAVRFDMDIDLFEGIIAANGVGYGIADWSIIENAFTGKGNDTVVGNDVNNLIDTGAGDDIITAGAGDDIIHGGTGSDTAIFSGEYNEYSISWDPDEGTITVVDTKASNGDDGTDVLTGVEKLIFADAEVNLSEQVGNSAPTANTSFFDTPIQIDESAGIEITIPDDAFTDDQGNSGLDITVSDPNGGELPEWLSYDEETDTFTGVPPADYLGLLQLQITATDDFDQKVSEILTLQFGPDQAPIVEDPREITLQEDQLVVALGFNAPVDPEGKSVSVIINELPAFGNVLDKQGNAIAVGRVLSSDEFTELFYQSAPNENGSAGYIRYTAQDEDGVTAQSSLRIFIDAVNDAPEFASASSQLTVEFPMDSAVPLDMLSPTDQESSITEVTIVELPAIGIVSLDGEPLTIGQTLDFTQLNNLFFDLDENVNGPIGAIGIEATDDDGLSTVWNLNIVVSGDAAFTEGSIGDDELYGSIDADQLYGKSGDDLLVGNAGDDLLLAGLGSDTVFGGSGNDRIDGSAGNDYLDGGEGDDLMAGGPGNDTYIVEQSGDVVLEVISGGAGGNDLVVTSLSMIAPTNIEALQAMDGFAINLSGNDLDNALVGNDEVNELSGGLGRDYLFANAGDDILDGGAGIDRLVGGLGNDTYYVDSKADSIIEFGNEGVDTVFTTSSYTLSSNVENLTATGIENVTLGGNSLDNHIIGNTGDNVLAGGIGSDILEGGLGDDIYVLSDDLDVIIDTGGSDTIRSSQNIELRDDIENAQLVGIADTYALGNELDNILQGNLGDNILDGGLGIDRLFGDEGADQFIISSNGDDVSSDEVLDFMSGTDLLVIDLASFGFDAEQLGETAAGIVSVDNFVSGAGATALDENDYFIYDTTTGTLYYDEDGNGEGEAIEIAKIEMDGESVDLGAGDIFVGI